MENVKPMTAQEAREMSERVLNKILNLSETRTLNDGEVELDFTETTKALFFYNSLATQTATILLIGQMIHPIFTQVLTKMRLMPNDMFTMWMRTEFPEMLKPVVAQYETALRNHSIMIQELEKIGVIIE